MLTGRWCGGTPESGLPSSQIDALGRLLEAGEHAEQRGLAAAGGAEQRVELALVDGERLVVDGDEVAEPLGDAAELDERLRRRVVPRLEFPPHCAEDVLCQVPRCPHDRRLHRGRRSRHACDEPRLLARLHFRPDRVIPAARADRPPSSCRAWRRGLRPDRSPGRCSTSSSSNSCEAEIAVGVEDEVRFRAAISGLAA